MTGSDAKVEEKPYSIWFVDSGSGGLIFLYDAYKTLNDGLKKLSSQYNVKFDLTHLAERDKIWSLKDDGLTPDQAERFTRNILNHAFKNGADSAVIACNTASTAFVNNNMERDFKIKYRNKTIFPIIQDSAVALLSHAKEDKDTAIGFFATPVTAESGMYQSIINDLQAKSGKKTPVNIVAVGTDWAQKVDDGVPPDEMMPGIRKAVAQMIKGAGGKHIEACGLFCTHFPALNDKIKEAFREQGYDDIKLISQGEVFAEKILAQAKQDIEKSVADGTIARRQASDKIMKDIPMTSRITGEGNKELIESAANKINPGLAKQTAFKREFPDRKNMLLVQRDEAVEEQRRIG